MYVPDYDPDDVTTWKFLHMSPASALASLALHAMAALALVSEPAPRQVQLSELAIAVTIELPTAAASSLAAAPPPAVDLAAHRDRPGWAGMDAGAPQLSERLAVAVPLPAPSEPHPRTILASTEPPPFAGRGSGGGASPLPAAFLRPARAMATESPALTGRELGMSAPSSVSKAPVLKTPAEPPSALHPVRQAEPRRDAQQQAADGARMAARLAAEHEAQEDYLRRIVRLLSHHRFLARNPAPEQGLVVASLTLARDGRLLDVRLAASSGFISLDRNVLDAIRAAAPFPPLPAAFAGERHSLIVPIVFRHER